jgi:hypothetical protein
MVKSFHEGPASFLAVLHYLPVEHFLYNAIPTIYTGEGDNADL